MTGIKVGIKRELLPTGGEGIDFGGRCDSCGFVVTGKVPLQEDYVFVLSDEEKDRIRRRHNSHSPKCSGKILIVDAVFTSFLGGDPEKPYVTEGKIKSPVIV